MTFFILGSHPDLSIAEILAVVGDKPVVARSKDVLVLNDVDQDMSLLQERLAGTIKIGKVIGEFKQWYEEEIVESIVKMAQQATGKNKISFGISSYGADHLDIKNIGKEIKTQLKLTERPVRFVTSKESQLSSVIVKENGLLVSGGEFVLIQIGAQLFLGHTQTVQDYKAWSDRDYGRPARDARSGMLPPKLARMMINLSEADPLTDTLLDPFCGSGTVPAEAMLMGFKKLIASDISEKAVEDTARNMTWLVDHAKIDPPEFGLFVQDARLIEKDIKKPVDAIVTETFLGDPKSRPLSHEEFQSAKDQLLHLYKPAFEALASILRSEGCFVLAIPTYRTPSGFQQLGIQPFLISIGFQVKQTFVYHRTNQVVGREIFVLIKT